MRGLFLFYSGRRNSILYVSGEKITEKNKLMMQEKEERLARVIIMDK